MIKVSIIVPIYKVAQYLDRCMESLLNQTLKDIEIIMIDDGSPDKCPEMCDDYAKKDSRIKVIHKANEGLGLARNSGLEIASGEYVAFVDSDDFTDIKMYEILYNKAHNSEVDAIYSGFNRVTSKRIIPIKEVNIETTFLGSSEIQDVLLDMIGCLPNVSTDRKYQMSVWHAIYKKDIIDRYYLRFKSEREYISEDIIFHIDFLSVAQKIIFIPDNYYYYCNNDFSLTKSFREDRFDKYIYLYNAIIERFNHNQIQTRAYRFIIGYTRTYFFLLPSYELSISNTYKHIKHIIKNPIWEDILINYKYKKLPTYQRLFLVLTVKKNAFLIMIVSCMINTIKKLK
jgi:glycosyltransferase involved in cell wall biosynthesis